MSPKRKSRRHSPRGWSNLVDFAAAKERNLFIVVALPLMLLFILTMRWTLPVNIDAFTNSISAYYIGTTGSAIATEHQELADSDVAHQFSWFVDNGDGAVSPYPPGGPYLAAIPYALSSPELLPITLTSTAYEDSKLESSVPTVWPASLVAALSSALAMGFLALAFGRVGSASQAIIAAYTAALGTSVWSVASDQLWQHGPSLMFLAGGVYLTLSRRWLLAGLLFGFAVFSREQNLIALALLGLGYSLVDRTPRPALLMALGSVPGVGALLWHNWTYLGIVGIDGFDLSDVSSARLMSLGLVAVVGVGALVFVGRVRLPVRPRVRAATEVLLLIVWLGLAFAGFRLDAQFDGVQVSVGDGPVVDLADAAPVEQTPFTRLAQFGWNSFQGVAGLDQGFLWWSPFLLVLLFAFPSAWRSSTVEPKLFLAAGLVLLVVQYWFQVYGHGAVFTYRYALEPLLVSSPFWFQAYRSHGWPVGVAAASVISVALHASGAIFNLV